MAVAYQESKTVVGRFPEDLSLAELEEHAGKWIAVERYVATGLREEKGQPEIDLRQRHIRAFAATVPECIRQLEQAGLDPRHFDFTQLRRS